MSKVVVSNVQVLTAGTRYDLEQARSGEPMPSTVVTLMVTPEEAERISLAGTEGQPVLTLRNPLDTKPTETEGIRSAALMGPAPKPPVIVRPSERPGCDPGRARATKDLHRRGHSGRTARQRRSSLNVAKRR